MGQMWVFQRCFVELGISAESHYYPLDTPHKRVLPETSFKDLLLQEHLAKVLPCGC